MVLLRHKKLTKTGNFFRLNSLTIIPSENFILSNENVTTLVIHKLNEILLMLLNRIATLIRQSMQFLQTSVISHFNINQKKTCNFSRPRIMNSYEKSKLF